MIPQLEPLLDFLSPLTSPFLALLLLLSMGQLLRRVKSAVGRAAAIFGIVAVFFALYKVIAANESADNWLSALNTPLITVILFVILPAMYLPRNRFYRYFLYLPVFILLLGATSVLISYLDVPSSERGFYWVLIRPAYLMGCVASLLVLIQPCLTMKWFRRAVRLAGLIVLLYGGFAFRMDYTDYKAMLDRRVDPKASGGMRLDDTVPVLNSEKRMLYLPSAPCRFSADGGYVQGCNIELFQRIMQLNFADIVSGNPAALQSLSLVLSALLLFLLLLFLTARWACGWLCPLSTLGDLLSYVRAKMGLPYFKPSQPIKVTSFTAGLSFAGICLLMAKAVPHLDASGKFIGCKIPIFPFCKICPAQQVCPVAATGLSGYPPVPASEWAFGFFRYGSLLLLAIFLLAFMTGRRLWCMFCPMGMISGLFNRGGMFTLRKNASKCNGCGVCAEVCPMDIDLVRSEMKDENVSSFDCVLCLKCVDKCPRDGCLSLEHNGIKVVESKWE